MSNFLQKVLDWKNIQSWCNSRFSLLGHEHSQYVSTSQIQQLAAGAYYPNWKCAKQIFRSYGNNAFQPIIQILVPGTIMVSIDGCGGTNPVIGILAAGNPNELLGSTTRTYVEHNGVLISGSEDSYVQSGLTQVCLAAASNSIGTTTCNAHIIPGKNTYIRPIAIGQCSTHIVTTTFIPDEIATTYDKYYQIVGAGNTVSVTHFQTYSVNNIDTKVGNIFSGDWKENFDGTIALPDIRSLTLGKPIRWYSGSSWVTTIPTHIPDTRVESTSSHESYVFHSSRYFIVDMLGRFDYTSNTAQGTPYTVSSSNNDNYTRNLSETESFVWAYSYIKDTTTTWYNGTLSLQHYPMTCTT